MHRARSAQSESPVPDRRLDRKGVGSSACVHRYGFLLRRMGTSLSRTRRERRLPLGGLTIDERLTSVRIASCNHGVVSTTPAGA